MAVLVAIMKHYRGFLRSSDDSWRLMLRVRLTRHERSMLSTQCTHPLRARNSCYVVDSIVPRRHTAVPGRTAYALDSRPGGLCCALDARAASRLELSTTYRTPVQAAWSKCEFAPPAMYSRSVLTPWQPLGMCGIRRTAQNPSS